MKNGKNPKGSKPKPPRVEVRSESGEEVDGEKALERLAEFTKRIVDVPKVRVPANPKHTWIYSSWSPLAQPLAANSLSLLPDIL